MPFVIRYVPDRRKTQNKASVENGGTLNTKCSNRNQSIWNKAADHYADALDYVFKLFKT